jgi:polyphosphate kinase 2 (PPK2 family)
MSLKFRSLLSQSEHKKVKTFFSSKEDYDDQLKSLQRKFLELQRRIHVNRFKIVILLEGPDAAGRGGVINRMTEYLFSNIFWICPTMSKEKDLMSARKTRLSPGSLRMKTSEIVESGPNTNPRTETF